MEELIHFCREYWVLSLLLLYFTVGRLSIVIAVVFGFGHIVWGPLLILSIELVQIPIVYNLYTLINRIVYKLKSFFSKRNKKESDLKDNQGDGAIEKGFFLKRFKKYGNMGIGILSSLPFKGCGVWSSLLLGRVLKVDKKKLYIIVAAGAIAGNLSLFFIGLLFNKTARALIENLNIDSSLRILFR